MKAALVLLLRCLSAEPEICPAAADAAMRHPDLAIYVALAREMETPTE